MFERLIEKFIKVEDVVGKGDELSGVMKMIVNDGSITEERAYEIKKQLTEEYNQGKVQKKALIVRLNFLEHGIDFPHDVGVLKEALSGNYQLCPYCFQNVNDDDEFCHICGYDLIHEEELNLDGVKIVDSVEELDLSSVNELSDKLDAKNGIEDYDDDIPLTEMIGNLENYGISSIHSFDDEYSNINSSDIDLFRIIINLNEGSTFDEACNDIYINSGLSNQELFDLAIKNNFINQNCEVLDDAYEFVLDNEWMYFYMYYLQSFNFDDFNRFYADNDYDLETAGMKFLDKHINIAHEKRDFSRLIASYQAKGHIYDHIRKYNKSLRYELKVFILKLNPIYLSEEDLLLHIPLDDYNVDTLCNFYNVYSLAQIKKYFNKEWKKIKFENIYINKKNSWKILINLLKGADVDDYCEKLEEKYFGGIL